MREIPCLTPEGRAMDRCPQTADALALYTGRAALPPAERLCVEAIASTVLSRSENPIRDTYADISWLVDRTLGAEVAQLKELLFAELLAQTHKFQTATSEESIKSFADLTYFLKITELSLFMPALRSRMRGESLENRLVSGIHTRLCDQIGQFEDRYVRTILSRDTAITHRNGRARHAAINLARSFCTQWEVAALVTRCGGILWPATEREESSHSRKQYNHDYYYLVNGRKVPVQIKKSADNSGYKNVVVITHYDILRAMKKMPEAHRINWEPNQNHQDHEWPSPYRTEHTLHPPRLDTIGDMLVSEECLRQQGKVDPELRTTLNLASMYVIARIEEYAREHNIL